jgi:hypothetical protein
MSSSVKQKRRDSFQWKNHRKVYQFKDEDKIEAIKSVHRISQKALKVALLDDSTRSVIFAHDMLDVPTDQPNSVVLRPSSTADLNSDNSCQSSYLSQERAIFRGSNRGTFEENENISSSITTLSGIKRRKKKKAKKAAKFMRSNQTQASNEAWMCGVCAKSFSSFEAANRHEDYHIKEIVTDLGWARNSVLERERSSLANINNFSSAFQSASEGIVPLDQQQQQQSDEQTSNVRSLTASSRQPSTAVHFSSPIPIRPDFLAVSNNTRLLSTRNINHQSQIPPPEMKAANNSTVDNALFEPMNESQELLTDHDVLVSHSIDDYVVLADEALTDVCLKAEKIALSQLEQEAEFELECYSKDKHYYDMLEQREIERQKEGSYSRFRTEGKNFAEKIQNKFVDAYAVMKQGKSQKTMASVDHYKRKLDGDMDVRNEISNTKHTLYVNVIVKNSIQVVSHELDRLARQRWEEHKKNEGGTDIRNDESRTQFEKFKAAAQGQLVQLAGLALASDFTPRRIAVQLSNDLYRYVFDFNLFSRQSFHDIFILMKI